MTLTALDICDEKGYQACSKLLKKHGAKSNKNLPHSAKKDSKPAPIKIPLQNGSAPHHDNKEYRNHERQSKHVSIQV